MTPLVIRSNLYCNICHIRIVNKRSARRMGIGSFEVFAIAYCQYSGKIYDSTDIVCANCHVNLKHGNYDLIKSHNLPILLNSQSLDLDCIVESLDPPRNEDYGITIYPNGNVHVDSQASTLYEDSISESPENEEIIIDGNQFSSGQNLQMPLANPACSTSADTRIQIRIPTVSRTEKKCFLCNGKGRSRIPKAAIINVWLKKKILVPMKNRVCSSHIGKDGMFKKEALERITATKSCANFSAADVKNFCEAFTDEREKSKFSKLDFNENSPLTENDYLKLTGLSLEDFSDLHLLISMHLRKSVNRSTRNALGLFLVKLRLNLSHQFLGFLFEINSLPKVSAIFESARLAMDKFFVPKHLGYEHISREEAKTHQSKQANVLLHSKEESLAVVIDGTYLYVQKSKDHELQKMTFSSHKHRNLLKPMLIAFTDGYILEAEGLFFANNNNNDAKILSNIINRPYGFTSFFKEDDQLVLDRGFRDVIQELETKQYEVFMPKLLARKQKQFSTEDANQSRLVTMVRWIIEAVNGRLKKWKYFDAVIEVSYFPKLGSLVRIACALINAYGTPFFTETENHVKLAEMALVKLDRTNQMQRKIEDMGLEKKRVQWVLATDEVKDFPKLTLEDLTYLTLGEYQKNMAENYTRQHLDSDSSYKIYLHKDLPCLVRGKIESRFVSGKAHQCWIEYDPSKQGISAIISYYCKCKVGSRVVGCCSHLTSIMWYLGYARYNKEKLLKRKKGLADNILNATDGIDREDLEEDSENDNE